MDGVEACMPTEKDMVYILKLISTQIYLFRRTVH
jgi:hypothetical protein